MTSRTRALTGGLLWALLSVASTIALHLAFRDRLPDPMASHWGISGTPDSSMSPVANLLVTLLIFAVLWGAAMGMAVHGAVFARRLGRAYWWGLLVWSGLFVVGIELSTLLANLDAATWADAHNPAGMILAVLVVSTLGGVAAGFALRGAPDQPSPPGESPPTLRLRAGERSAWVSRTANRWLGLLVVLPVVAMIIIAVLWSIGVARSSVAWLVLGTSLIIFVAGLLTFSISVRVSESGIAIGFGPFGWPVYRIRLAKVESAWVEERYPSQVGGWGIRGLPGMAAIMIRGGDCLVLRYRSGGQLVISIDDARTGASLINALIAERAVE